MQAIRFVFVFLLLFGVVGAWTQAEKVVMDHTLLLASGPFTPEPNLDQWVGPSSFSVLDKVGDAYFAIVQFHTMPGERERRILLENGVELLEYIPHLAYYVKINEEFSLGAVTPLLRGIYPMEDQDKVASTLWERPFPPGNEYAGKVLLRIYWQGDNGAGILASNISAKGGELLDIQNSERWMKFWVPEHEIEWLATQDELYYAELFPTQGEPDDSRGRSLHRVNRMQGNGPFPGNFTGKGIDVIVRDDGIVGPHIDFAGRLNQQFAFNDDPNRSHGDGVSGILGGAGNLDPDNAGMATGATMHILNYRQDQNDSVEFLHRNYGAVIVSTSYSDGCNVGYTGNARTIDRHTWENPTLLHIFSAGNSNNNNCGYGAGNQWGNITGGHKMAKNSIATANVFYDATLVGSSSRGPAHDGRLKPEISAFGQGQISTFAGNVYNGFGGTSAAAPGISGVSACLNEAYRSFNNGSVPDAALVKAAIMNTANDLGETGPDFQYGFGLINGYRALKLMENEQYAAISVDQGQEVEASVLLDRPAKEVKVMVYWTDAPGTLFSSRALVNDLDLTVSGPDQTIHYPLILDPTPDPLILSQPAKPGVDHLNNVEQVVIRDAEAGTYQVKVSGFEVPFEAVSAWIVYDIVYDEVHVSYPAGGEAFEPGTTESIRWDAPADTSAFSLSYSLDGGVNWFNVATVNRVLRTFDWEVPQTRSGQVIFRITRSDGTVGTSDPFSIYPRPENVRVIAACPDALTLSFDTVPDATGYIGYRLGAEFMEEVSFSDSNVLSIPINSPERENWVAVVAVGDEGRRSKRTIALYYDAGLLNCSLDNDLRLTRIISPTAGEDYVCLDGEKLVTVEIVNNGQLPQSDFDMFYQVNGDAPVKEQFPGTVNPGEKAVHTFSAPIDPLSSRELEVWYELPENQYAFDDRKRIELKFLDRFEEELPYREDFDDYDSLLLTWLVEFSDESVNWKTQKVVQSDGSNGFSISFENFEFSPTQQEFGIQSGKIPLSGIDRPWLYYDLSYANRDTSKNDQLGLEVSIDCGNTFERILQLDRDQLNTWNALPVAWTPRRSRHWRNDSISLEAFAGEEIVLRWVNISAGGNNVFLDNFEIRENLMTATDNNVGLKGHGEVVIAPNPVASNLRFNFTSASNGQFSYQVIDITGNLLKTGLLMGDDDNFAEENVDELPSGVYVLRILDKGKQVAIQRFVKI